MTESWWVPPRSGASELIDLPETSFDDVLKGMRDVQRINGLLATYPLLFRALAQRVTWPVGRPLRVLDVATGLADIPRALVDWATKSGHAIEVVGLDLNPRILTMAAETLAPYPQITLIEADALAMPFADGAFDWAMCHLALHHFPPHTHVAFLKELDRVVRPGGGILLGDLERSRLNVWLARPFLKLFTSPIAQHDGIVSIQNSLSAREIDQLPEDAGVRYLARARLAPPTQYILVGVKPPDPLPSER